MHYFSSFGTASEASTKEKRFLFETAETPKPFTNIDEANKEFAKQAIELKEQKTVLAEAMKRIQELENLKATGNLPQAAADGSVILTSLQQRPSIQSRTGYEAYLMKMGEYALFGYPYQSRYPRRGRRSYGAPIGMTSFPHEGMVRTRYQDRMKTIEVFEGGAWNIHHQISAEELFEQSRQENARIAMAREQERAQRHSTLQFVANWRKNPHSSQFRGGYQGGGMQYRVTPQDIDVMRHIEASGERAYPMGPQSVYLDRDVRTGSDSTGMKMLKFQEEDALSRLYSGEFNRLFITNPAAQKAVEEYRRAERVQSDPHNAAHMITVLEKIQKGEKIKDQYREGSERPEKAKILHTKYVNLRNGSDDPSPKYTIEIPDLEHDRTRYVFLHPNNVNVWNNYSSVQVAKQFGIYCEIDRLGDGTPDSMNIHFTKPGTYFMNGERIVIRESGKTVKDIVPLTNDIKNAPSIGPLTSTVSGEPTVLYFGSQMPGQAGKATKIDVSKIQRGEMRISADKKYTVYRNEKNELRLVTHVAGSFEVKARFADGISEASLGSFTVAQNKIAPRPELPEEDAAREEQQRADDEATIEDILGGDVETDTSEDEDASTLDEFLPETPTAPPSAPTT